LGAQDSKISGVRMLESNIKVIEVKGKKQGKEVLVLAGVHGNEICGPRAFDKIIPNLEIESGNVTFIYANLEAMRKNVRFVEANLNRCFMKDQSEEIRETLEGKTAREIIPFLEKADVVLDLHASNTKDSVPFVICSEQLVSDAKIFDAGIVTYNFDPFEQGTTNHFMNLAGKKAFAVECGYAADPETQKVAEKEITNFLSYVGCIESEIELKSNQRVLKIVYVHKNKNAPYKNSRYFPDFEKLKEKTLIGKEGNEELYGEKGQIVLFTRDRDNLNFECFLLAEEGE